MKMKIRTTLFAGAIVALLAGPLWAAGETPREGAYPATPGAAAPAGAETGQSDRSLPTTAQPLSDAPKLDGSYVSPTARTSAADNPLYARSADDLDGVEVVDRTGDTVGDIKQIVLAPDRKSAHAVISVGGILGMGTRDIMISLDDLSPVGDKLQMSATKAEATAKKDDDPDADRYVEVTGDTPISGSIIEFSAFEQDKDATTPGSGTMMKPPVESGHPATVPAPATAPATPRVPQ